LTAWAGATTLTPTTQQQLAQLAHTTDKALTRIGFPAVTTAFALLAAQYFRDGRYLLALVITAGTPAFGYLTHHRLITKLGPKTPHPRPALITAFPSLASYGLLLLLTLPATYSPTTFWITTLTLTALTTTAWTTHKTLTHPTPLTPTH